MAMRPILVADLFPEVTRRLLELLRSLSAFRLATSAVGLSATSGWWRSLLLALATLATLFVIPCVFALAQRGGTTASVSLDPDDAGSRYYDS